MKNQPSYFSNLGKSGFPSIIAHRGASGFVPENTIESFSLGLYQHCDFIELDVCLTKDKELVILHDPFISEMTNIDSYTDNKFKDKKKKKVFIKAYKKFFEDYFVDDFTLEEVKQLRIKQFKEGRTNIFDNLFQIPTLSEVLTFLIQENKKRKKKIGIFLEIKENIYEENFGKGFSPEELILNTLKEFNLETIEKSEELCPIIVVSFEQSSLEFIKENSNLPTLYCLMDKNVNYGEISSFADGISVSWDHFFDNLQYETSKNSEKDKENLVFNDNLKNARENGLKVGVWTLRDEDLLFGKNYIDMYYTYYKIGIDCILTDFPSSCKTIFDSLKFLNK